MLDKPLDKPYEELLLHIKDSKKCILLSYFCLQKDRTGAITEKLLLTEEDLEEKSYHLPDDIYEHIRLSLDSGKLKLVSLAQDKLLLIEPFAPRPRLIVFGGGHIAIPLVQFDAKVGFSVTVIDDRPYFANAERFPEADKVICQSFEKSFDYIHLRETDFVVIITRGHRYDGVVLREILKHKLRYTGMIGSKRRVNAMMEELYEEGYDKESLSAVNAPIGLDIGAVTPEEIAISIVSQLISYKNQSLMDRFGKNFSFPELDEAAAEAISQESAVPMALITILSTKGSVPRKAGAKMTAYYDGRTIGSIGGGCSEAEIVAKSRDMMLKKGFAIERIDMTGEAAEDDGMVCGGTMEVLIEVF